MCVCACVWCVRACMCVCDRYWIQYALYIFSLALVARKFSDTILWHDSLAPMALPQATLQLVADLRRHIRCSLSQICDGTWHMHKWTRVPCLRICAVTKYSQFTGRDTLACCAWHAVVRILICISNLHILSSATHL